MPDELIDASEAARRLGLRPTTVKRMARDGRILAYRVDRRWLFDPENLAVTPWMDFHSWVRVPVTA